MSLEKRVGSQGTTSETTFVVSAGPEGLTLLVQAGGRTIPIAIDSEKAGTLGLALLVGSAICAPANPRPATETPIESAPPLPLTAIEWGVVEGTGNPVVVAQALGGTKIPLRFTKEQARGCGAALLKAGQE